jgi:hypothetical protein
MNPSEVTDASHDAHAYELTIDPQPSTSAAGAAGTLDKGKLKSTSLPHAGVLASMPATPHGMRVDVRTPCRCRARRKALSPRWLKCSACREGWT